MAFRQQGQTQQLDEEVEKEQREEDRLDRKDSNK